MVQKSLKNTGKGYVNNTKNKIKARIVDRNISGLKMYTWYTLDIGDTVECSLEEAKIYKLIPVGEKSEIVNETPTEVKKRLEEENEALKAEGMLHEDYQGQKAEEKPTEEESKEEPKADEINKEEARSIYIKKLCKIDGVGLKTANDIEKIYPTEEDLKKAIKDNKEIPLRDDVAKTLKKVFK